MQVLYITARFPGLERRGDQQRAYQQLLHLAERHAITLLSLEPAPPDAPARRALEACCARVWTLPRSRLRRWWLTFTALPGALPLQVAAQDGAAASAALRALLGQTRFDGVHLQLARLGGALPALAGLPVVLDLVDALSLNMQRRAQRDRGVLRWIAALEARRLRRYEQQLLAQVALACVSAEPDRLALGGGERLALVPNGIDPAHYAVELAPRERQRLVFVGNLGYFPNVDAVAWFLDAVWPGLHARHPRARLDLVGARPAARLRRLAQRCSGVTVVGPVDDVVPWLQRADIAIAPLRCGSGQQLKILEAMAAGTPVVASRLSASAMTGDEDRGNGALLAVADDADAMLASIEALWADPAGARAMAERARTHVLAEHSWAHSARVLEQLWEQAFARAQPCTRRP